MDIFKVVLDMVDDVIFEFIGEWYIEDNKYGIVFWFVLYVKLLLVIVVVLILVVFLVFVFFSLEIEIKLFVCDMNDISSGDGVN